MEINKILPIDEQESFMHLIYDVIHNGISIVSLDIRLKNMETIYGDLKNILNSRLKNERYSKTFDIPIMKVILEDKNHNLNLTYNEFNEKKKDVIKLFRSYGASLNILNEKYMDENPYFDFFVHIGLIDKEIYDLIKKESEKRIVISL